MPSFERLFDDLAIHLAKDDIEKNYIEGFIDGKRSARKESNRYILTLFVAAIIPLVFGFTPIPILVSILITVFGISWASRVTAIPTRLKKK